MDHSCHKCGHSTEDGKPFCSQCGAPQIRVAMPEPLVPAVAGNVAPDDLPAFTLDPPLARPLVSPAALSGIDWPHALRSCAVAALISALVMSLGLMVPLLAGLGAGVLGVTLYRRRISLAKVTARSGAQLGAVSGVFFFGISTIFQTLAIALLHNGGQVRQKMLEALQQAASRTADPQVQAALDRLKTPEGMVAMMILGMVFLFVLSIAAGSIAGALTGAFLNRKR